MPEVLTYWHTLRYLKPVQIFGRIWFYLFHPRPDQSHTPPRRTTQTMFVGPCRRNPTMTNLGQFTFLNESGSVNSASDWNNPEKTKLWLYNLHYFDDMNAVGAVERHEWHRSLIQRWIDENPPVRGVGWEPYPTSLRIVNWIKWSLNCDDLSASASHSLAVQIRWLRKKIEYHLLGNHLFANSKALIFAGCFFKGHEAEQWFHDGYTIINRELKEQVLLDGGHFELSPMYHLIVLEDLLDLINILQAFGYDAPESWIDSIIRMLCWADVMTHPDGEIPFFNDAALGVAPRFSELKEYAEKLGIQHKYRQNTPIVLLSHSGYSRMCTKNFTAFLDTARVGPNYLPGHAHADTLSLELSMGKERILVNSGTSLYRKNAERQWQRGTAAHNTVSVDGLNSSDVWAGFRVGRRAYVHDIVDDIENIRLSAWHDGFLHLPGKLKHFRSVSLSDTSLNVIDRVTGIGEHRIQGFWYLHPEVTVKLDQLRQKNQVYLHHQAMPNQIIFVSFDGPVQVKIEPSIYYPEFGVKISNRRLVYEYQGRLPVEVRSIITLISES